MGDRILLIIFLIFCITAAVQIFYYCYFYLAVYLYKDNKEKISPQPVSVIICARNEAENLSRFLPSVLEQDYKNYEVIVVNDCSEDSTYDVLGKFLEQYPHLRISTINKDPKFTHNKKFAQFIGIKAAKNEILLFTDADCQPLTKKWIEGMTANFNLNTSYVLGYGGYFSNPGLLNSYIRYDSAFIAMQYLGMAIKGIPYMGVGRNMAYRRSEFFSNNGFKSHTHLASGDDDLFINNNALSQNTKVEIKTETHTRSVASQTFRDWVTQKSRHLTTAPFYKMRDKMLLVTEPSSKLVFYAAFIILMTLNSYRYAALGIFCLRLITQVTVFSLVMKRLEEKGLVFYSLFFDIFSPFVNGILFLGSKRRQPGRNAWR
jgi:glycosyltransferase involved in cell wall biosynthesis